METGRKILNLRKDLGVQQKTLAGLTAVTPSALSRIEAGVHQPRGQVDPGLMSVDDMGFGAAALEGPGQPKLGADPIPVGVNVSQ